MKRPLLLGVAVGTAVATAATTLGTAAADQPAVPGEPSGVSPIVRQVTVPDVDAGDLVGSLKPKKVETFSLVGVTWDPGYDAEGLTVKVRVRKDGQWSAWKDLPVSEESVDAGRPGTEPLWVEKADALSVRARNADGQSPDGLKATTVQSPPAASDAEVTGQAAATATAAAGPSYTPRPTIIRRSSWGAASARSCDSPRSSNETRGVVVHHTAGSNRYSQSQSASIVRNVQAFHMQGRGWCDIGYNYLVDRFGRIFEGRAGGLDVPVRGAHAGNRSVNMYTMGVSMMGTFSSVEPTAELKRAVVLLASWRLGTTYHPARGTYALAGSRYSRINGHRNVVSTECPGAAGYRWIGKSGGLRDRVADYISGYASKSKTEYLRLGYDRTGPVTIGEYPFTQRGGGRKVKAARVHVFSTQATGVQAVGVALPEYVRYDSQAGVYGLPVAPLQKTNVPDVVKQRFQSGCIYRVPGYGTLGIWAPLERAYNNAGGPAGYLGSPVRRYASLGDGRHRAYFENGTITRNANGQVVVSRS